MKKIASMMMSIAMAVSLALPAAAAEAETDVEVSGVAPDFTDFTQAKALLAAEDPEKVLLVMNQLPWGTSSNQQALNSLGLPYDTVGIQQLDEINLTNYRMIMVANAQDYSFYSEYNSVKDELEDYVEAGGSLLMGICDFSFAGFSTSLPGGVNSTWEGEYNNYIADAEHPIVTGELTDNSPLTNAQLYGTFASHRHVDDSSLPAGSNIILRGSDSHQATLVEYPLGDGTVIASGLTWEFYYNGTFTHAFDDLILYAYNGSDIEPNPDYLAIATQLVEQAEQDQTQQSVDEAQAAINNVPDGEDKTELQARLDAVKKAIQDITTIGGYLQDILDDTLTSKTGIDAAIDKLNKAKKLYQGLPEGDGTTALGEVLDQAQNAIEEALLSILETTVGGKPYILTGKQMTIMIQHAIDHVEATSQADIDEVMEYLMPLVQGHTNLSEAWIRGMVQLYLPQSQPL